MTTTSNKAIYLLLIILLAFTLTHCQDANATTVDQHADEHEDQHADQHADEHAQESEVITIPQRWGFGFLAGLGVSLIGFLTALIIVFCKNLASDACFEMTIKSLFSLAFGALLGDAMIHILPEAYKSEEGDFRVVAGIFVGSIVFFLILERLFQACGITHKHWHNDECHDDHEGAIKHHNHPRKIYNEDHQGSNKENSIKVVELKSNNQILDQNQSPTKKSKISTEQVINHTRHHSHDHDHNHEEEKKSDSDDQKSKSCWQNLKGKGSAGYLNLLGSLIHNFMDGLALGVAFATGDKKVFVPVLVAIIAHEIPRQMGDVAILMTNSFNAVQTVLCNGFVNLISLVGVFIGLGISQLNDVAKSYVLVFVAGNFIFIAADIWKNLFKNGGFWKNFIEFIGFGVGIAAMYLILLLESEEAGHDH